MFKNIENAITDTEVLVGNNHFPIKADYMGLLNGWHIVIFKNDANHTLEVEVQIDDANESVIMGVLSQAGFTNDQMNIIMDTFQDQF
uniref:Uncharacterized protein n=1 Tax=viral metagenome TaxID=1070528 RepID=A0A6C0KFZ7_9ZZZZ